MTHTKRIHTIDELRGFCVVCMVFYHGFFTAGFMFGIGFARYLFDFFTPVEPLFAGIFIVISGISSQLSHSNIRRGLILLGISILLSIVTILFIPGAEIYFGILHFLAVSIILFAFSEKYIDKIPVKIAVALFVLLFIVTYSVSDRAIGIKGVISYPLPVSLYKNNVFMMLGFVNSKFYSADYFPLLPWIFAFLFGTVIGRFAKDEKFPQFMYKSRVKPLSYIGNHALIIYIVHQPVIYGVFYLLDMAFEI